MLQVHTEPRADSLGEQQCQRESIQDKVTSHVAPKKINPHFRQKTFVEAPHEEKKWGIHMSFEVYTSLFKIRD